MGPFSRASRKTSPTTGLYDENYRRTQEIVGYAEETYLMVMRSRGDMDRKLEKLLVWSVQNRMFWKRTLDSAGIYLAWAIEAEEAGDFSRSMRLAKAAEEQQKLARMYEKENRRLAKKIANREQRLAKSASTKEK